MFGSYFFAQCWRSFSSIGFLVVVDIMNFWHTNEAEDTAEECAQLAIVLAPSERSDKEARACRGLSSIHELVSITWRMLRYTFGRLLWMYVKYEFTFSSSSKLLLLEHWTRSWTHKAPLGAHSRNSLFITRLSSLFIVEIFCRKARRKLRTISRPRLF